MLSWLQCFSLFAGIVISKHPEKAKELLAYQTLMISNPAGLGEEAGHSMMPVLDKKFSPSPQPILALSTSPRTQPPFLPCEVGDSSALAAWERTTHMKNVPFILERTYLWFMPYRSTVSQDVDPRSRRAKPKHKGFRIGFAYSKCVCISAKSNMGSASQNPSIIDKYVEQGLALHRFMGPLDSSLAGHVHHVNRFGVIPKTPSTWQMEVDD